jgi:ATP/maltotriose-dependent transcriptional regulator MalT
MLVNVPALIAVRRGFLAQLRGDAEAGAAFASRALAECREGEWLLSSTARGFLAMAEWLQGRLAEAERAFASSTAGWQAAGQPALTAWHRVQLAQVQRALGRLDAAVQTYEGPPMAALLTRLIAAQRAGSGFQAAASVPLGYLARLRSAFGAEPAAPHAAAVPGLIDPLTSRELEVLQMLAAGKSNQAIAGQLVVTLDTVKKHVSHLLGKLGAANRTEAVTRARELGLTP